MLGELAWHSVCVMDCHAAAWGSIPCGNGVKTELHVNGGAVSKRPCCQWNAKHNQPVNAEIWA